MTTKVTVETHTWPVQVVAADKHLDGSVGHSVLAIVPPNSKSEHLYVTDSRQLIVTEMREPVGT